MDLVKTSGGLSIWFKKVSGSSGFLKISTAEPSHATKEYLPLNNFFLHF